MRIIKANDENSISVYEEDIEQQYLEFTHDMKNFNDCDELIQTFNENKMFFCDIICCLNHVKSEVNSYLSDKTYCKFQKAINAYLSNLQPYLSAINKHVSKTEFINITHIVYDNHKEYQLCYELRNVLQHKGFKLYITGENDTQIKVFIDKKDLLEDFHIKAKTRLLLTNYPEQIDLINEINGCYKAQYEILIKVYLAIYNISAHERLLNFHVRNTDAQFLCIGDYYKAINTDGKESLELKFFYFDKNKILENINFYENAEKYIKVNNK